MIWMSKKQELEEIGADLKSIKVKMGELEASVLALKGMRETFDTRFTTLSEKIGEIRSMVLTQAKEGAEVKAKVDRAVIALEGIKPEEFRAAIMRRDAEIEALKAKLSSTTDMVRTLMDELKEFRSSLAKFKGMEAVMGMSDDARKNIIRIQQLRDQVEVMSDKVMSAFLEFQRRFREVGDLSIRTAALEENLKSISKSLSQMDVLSKEVVTKAEFNKLIGERSASSEYANQKTSKELAKLSERVADIERVVSQIMKLILEE